MTLGVIMGVKGVKKSVNLPTYDVQSVYISSYLLFHIRNSMLVSIYDQF